MTSCSSFLETAPKERSLSCDRQLESVGRGRAAIHWERVLTRESKYDSGDSIEGTEKRSTSEALSKQEPKYTG